MDQQMKEIKTLEGFTDKGRVRSKIKTSVVSLHHCV
jgi:hypothetical protein